MEQNAGQLERRRKRLSRKQKSRMLRRIKGITLTDRIRSVDIRKELGVSSIQEKVREINTTLVWTHAENGRKRSESSW